MFGGEDVDRTILVALRAQKLDEAGRLIADRLIVDPNDQATLQLHADWLWQTGDPNAAVEVYLSLLQRDEQPPVRSFRKVIDACLMVGRPYTAVDVLSRAATVHPTDMQFHYDLSGICIAAGLRDRAVGSLQTLLRRGVLDLQMMTVVTDRSRVKPDWEYIYKLVREHPEQEELQFGLAAIDAAHLQYREASEKLAMLLERRPEMAEAQWLMGRCLIELDETDRLVDWAEQLPDSMRTGPQFWMTAARFAQNQGRHEEACRGFWEVLGDHPSEIEALMGLYQSLLQLDRTDEAERISDLLRLESKLRNQLSRFVQGDEMSQRLALVVAKTINQLGRLWEANAWAQLAKTADYDQVDAVDQIARTLSAAVRPSLPWQLASRSPTEQVKLDDLPLPRWQDAGRSGPAIQNARWLPPRLADQTRRRGLEHSSLGNFDADERGLWIYQAVGGGVSVVDFDLDGWPDVAAAVLDGTPGRRDSSGSLLLRNESGRFVPATDPAGYHDTGYGQSVAVGDLNNDGFADLFNTNIGGNRVFINNGDGTFSDQTERWGMSGQRWSTSAVIADLDGDGLSDVFESCYCAGEEPLTQHCGGDSDMVTCSPLFFAGEPDVMWRGQPGGRLVADEHLSDAVAAVGRGLGIVAGGLVNDAGVSNGLDCFVANDMSANHLWTPRGNSKSATETSGKATLDETGTFRGVGLSGTSLAQASMGIAAADPDADGDLDFYVTHFTLDYNTYYEQVSPGIWADRTFQRGLLAPTMNLLGFGTQWVDFSNRGTLDLVIANGHVNKLKNSIEPYRMKPQMFGQQGDGRWSLYEEADVGEYFQTEHLGRAVAISDVDRDGRQDLLITHVSEPTKLLINQTTTSQTTDQTEADTPADAGHYLRLVLKAHDTQRDAIGATVTIDGPNGRTFHLLAGDGYLCSNQRVIHIGLDERSDARDLEIRWPSGSVQSLGPLAVDREYLVVQDQPAFELTGPPPLAQSPLLATE